MWTGLMECRSFQELVDSTPPLETGCGHVFIASWIPTAKVCFCPECKKEVLIERQYGMMLKHWRVEACAEMSISSSAASRNDHARTLAVQDLERAWQESEADYFSRSLDCVAKLSRDGSFWKMSLPLLPEEEWKWLGPLPRWGIVKDGELYPLKKSELPICENVGSAWLGTLTATMKIRSKNWRSQFNRLPTPQEFISIPTPCARDFRIGKRKNRSKLRKSQLCEWIGIQKESDYGKKLCPKWLEQLMGFPSGWTELEDWAMQWYRLNVKKRSKS